METRTTRTKLVAIILSLTAAAVIWTVWGAGRVDAIQDSEDFPPPFGIAQGQTARVNILNVGDSGIIIIGGKFLDSRNNVVREFVREPIEVAPGRFMSFDFSGDEHNALADISGRIQLRAVVTALGGPDTRRNLITSVEVIDDATGKTTVLIDSAIRRR
jgi:hypothetical protein